MNICVCVKQVPDTNEIKINPVTHTLIRDGVPCIVNPFDAYAVEAGARLKEMTGGRLVIVTMGPPQAEKAIRSCLEVGADTGYLVSGRKFGGSDTLATSYILTETIREIERREGFTFDLILCGKQAIDGDTAQVGPEIAEHMGYPQVTYALDLEASREELHVKRECDNGYDIVGVKLPAVVTVVRLPYEPRYPSIRTRREARGKQVQVLSEADLSTIDLSRCGLTGSPTKVKRSYTPVHEKSGMTFKDIPAEEAVKQLMQKLTEAKLV